MTESKIDSEAISAKKTEPSQLGLRGLTDFLRGTHVVLPIAVIGIFLICFVGLLYFARTFFMPLVLAILLNFLLKPAVRVFGKIHLPDSVGAILVIAMFFAVVVLLFSQLAGPVGDWARDPEPHFREIRFKLESMLRPARRITEAAQQVREIGDKEQPAQVQPQKVELQNNGSWTGPVFGYARSFLAGVLETFVLLYFLLAAGDLFLHKLMKILPSLKDKKRAIDITTELQKNISAFLITITIINTCLGVLVGLAAHFIGMPNPMLWGVLAGILNFIPYFGPISGVAILAVGGLMTFDGIGQALLAPSVYLLLHGIESNLLTPMILGRRLTMNPVIIFVSLMFWTWLWGIPGALLSIPMLMMVKILCDHFKPLASISELISG